MLKVLEKALITKLKTILQSKYLYLVLVIITIIYVYINISVIKKNSSYNILDNEFIFKVINIKNTDNNKIITFKGKEKVICYYEGNFNYKIGDKVKVLGKLELPKNNTIPNLFNYKKYLYNNDIFYQIKVKDIMLVSKNSNIFTKIRNNFVNRIKKYKSKNYLFAFIIGDTSYIDSTINESYQKIGVNHLLAIGGMQLTIVIAVMNFLLKKINIKDIIAFIIILLFVMYYVYLANYQISMLRSVLSYIISFINKRFKLGISIEIIVLISLIIVLLINPFNIYNLGFQYSYLITFVLIKYKTCINGNYLKKLFIISLIAYLSSIPINIYNNYEINYLSIIYNIFYVPLINIIVFPLSLITLIIPIFDNALFLIMNILESITSFLSDINTYIILRRINVLIIIIYYIIIIYCLNGLKLRKYKRFLIFLISITIHNNINYLLNESYMLMLDVGQGDSILINSNHETLLIDTGGSNNYEYSDKLIKLFKSLGIKKINKLIITHGDNDHIGSSYNLANNFTVEEVYFNNNEFNDNEIKLINILNKKLIKYQKILDKCFTFGNNNLCSINNNFFNENESSIVLYGKINNYKIIMMGDATRKVENNILANYSIRDVDILKVGHHGSKTSTSEEFVKILNPKISLIGVGLNNIYHLPSKSVIDILRNSKVYETRYSGSILINFNKNGTIYVYEP